MGYDIENRLESESGVKRYSYDAGNRRVFDDTRTFGKYTFWAPDGRRLAYYDLPPAQCSVAACVTKVYEANVYFDGRVMAHSLVGSVNGYVFEAVIADRLGSVRKRGTGGANLSYYPYGVERVTTANDGSEKFGTYQRGANGLDYANQRYYSPGSGRFLTIDAADAEEGTPSSWNRFAYAWGDPVNLNDPDGLLPGSVEYEGGGGFGCVSTPFLPGASTGDASNACPPGMTMSYSRGGSGTTSRTQLAFDLFSNIPQSVIGDWDYTGSPYRYEISLSNDQYDGLVAAGLLQAGVGVIVRDGPKIWDKVVVVGLGIIEGIRQLVESRRLYTVTVDCSVHRVGTADHESVGRVTGQGTGVTLPQARNAAVSDANWRAAQQFGNGHHAQHCSPGTISR
jgi:RHS repeat-associated protein